MKRKTLLLLAVLAGTLLAGCTSLPAPDSENDTAFVLPVERIQQSTGGSTFGYYEVHIGKPGDHLHLAPGIDLDGDDHRARAGTV